MKKMYSDPMVRKNHFIPKHQDEQLAMIFEQSGIRASEIVRRGIDLYIKTFHKTIYDEYKNERK